MIWIAIICTATTVAFLGAVINAWRVHLKKNEELH
ncbi:hypothetical protein SAMN04490203_2542 [Pseudomonas taetrolens]|uniref:Uncharacterized protein n=1 Tax=Pseudomonas taetrolens TaxID=47884 RepID=A0A1H4T277_PSETA|nr:hypothetical protein SAMN04490203_2542 [Pseudomonas taetrolens]SQF86693.1 Uncharacterised protein [Pseudomonas taetrolens]VEH49769.1 Uncharacterised protein [Pseudomonas taetrolens]